MQTVSLRWHLFCRVIDNFGDIGVCWRLARQLQQVHGQQISLWVDDLASFAALEPGVNPVLPQQQVQGIAVYRWDEAFRLPADEPEVVVETFACELPPLYLQWMQQLTQQRGQQPVWINLEYLSAEDWVRSCHGSPSPVHGMNKTFFFPGFTEGTGGLLFDAGLPALAQQLASAEARAAELALYGVRNIAANTRLISLFAYENPALPHLLENLQQGPQPVCLLIPQGRISAGVEAWLQQPLPVGQPQQRGALTLCTLPFLSQPQYDRLLALCDLNCVRGEESFVRAQMLGKPMLWHIYQQEEDAHLVKLEAFMALYLQQAAPELRESLLTLFRGWNQPGLPMPDLQPLLAAPLVWQQHASEWQQGLLRLGDLAANLVQQVVNRV